MRGQMGVFWLNIDRENKGIDGTKDKRIDIENNGTYNSLLAKY